MVPLIFHEGGVTQLLRQQGLLKRLASFPGRFVGGGKNGPVSIVYACAKYSVYSADIF